MAKRRENFCREEKEFVLNYVKQNKNIIEYKGTDARKNNEKRLKWEDLAKKMRCLGFHREWKDIRASYQRWKVAAKKNICSYSKYRRATGGGESKAEPSNFDYMISDICPLDFEEDENPADSDNFEVTIKK